MKSLCVLALLLAVSPAAARELDDWRPFLFSTDGRTLAARTAAVESGAGYNGVTGTGGSLQPDDARRVTGWLAASVGVVNRVNVDGTIAFGDDPTNGVGLNQARLELRVRVLGPFPKFPVAISLGGGYQADALLESAVTGVVAATAAFGRLNLTFNLRAAHYFHPGRDPIDLFVTAGALVRVTRLLRLGAEYVGEELEGVRGDDADGSLGGRHYVGPTGVLYLHDGRVRINATGGAVITPGQAGPLVRGSVAYVS